MFGLVLLACLGTIVFFGTLVWIGASKPTGRDQILAQPVAPSSFAEPPLNIDQKHAVFLFQGDRLIDANRAGSTEVDLNPIDADWPQISANFSNFFIGLLESLSKIEETLLLDSLGLDRTMEFQRLGDRIKVSIGEAQPLENAEFDPYHDRFL